MIASRVAVAEAMMDEMLTTDTIRVAFSLLDAVGDAVVARDIDGRVTYWNAGAERLYGWSAEETLGQSMLERTASLLSEAQLAEIRAVLAAGDSWVGEVIAQHRDGTAFPARATQTPLLNEDGVRIGTLGISSDLRERRKAEEALRRSEERFRMAAQASNDLIWDHDFGTNETRYSDRLGEILRYSSIAPFDSLENWCAAIHPDDRAGFEATLQAAVTARDSILIHEYRFRRGDGTWAYLLDRGYLTYDAAGLPVRGVGAILDLTERKAAEDALRVSEEKYRRLFDTMAQGVLYHDAAGAVLHANPAALDILGRDLDELRGCTGAEPDWQMQDESGALLTPDRIPALIAARTGTEICGRMLSLHNRREQRRRWLLVHALPQFDADTGEVCGGFTTLTDVTDLHRTETALRRGQERLRLITNTVQEVFYLVRCEPASIDYLSPAFEKIWGLPVAAAAADPQQILQAVLPEDRTRARHFTGSIGPSGAQQTEYRIRRPDGEVRWIQDQCYRVHREGLDQIVGTAQDITERKLAEEQVRRSRQQLHRIVETVSEGIVIIDPDGSITFANPAAQELLGMSHAAAARGSFSAPAWKVRTADGAERPAELPPAARVLATGSAVHGAEHHIQRPDASRAILSVNAAALRDPDARIQGVVASMRDVTEARLAEDRVRFQAALLDAVGETVAATDLEGRILFWNRQAQQLSGVAAADALGRPLSDMFVPAGPERSIERLLVRIVRGESWTGELQLTSRHTGRNLPAFVSGAPIRDKDGTVTGMVIACSDLSDVKRLEQELQQAQRLQAVGRLAGGVAHDFNNILTAVRGYAEFLVEELRPSDPLRADAEEIRRAADRAAGLTRQLLAFSRKQVLQPRVLDLGNVIAGMERMLARVIGEDIELVFSCMPRLGRVKADPAQLEQVLMNLVVNARDAMPGGGRLEIALQNSAAAPGCAPAEHGWVHLRVSDSGHGIAPEVLPHVFEPFFTTKEQGSGTGLGLSTVYGIIAQSGGHVHAENAAAGGAVFDVYLPRVMDEEEAPRTHDRSLRSRGETILLAEDEDAVRVLTARTLRRVGYHVLEARHGGEALLLCERHEGEIHLLLTDVVMPQMNGRDLSRRLLLVRPALRVLYMSGYTADIIAQHGVLADDEAYLQKPFSPAMLATRVREVLDEVRGVAE